MAKKKSNEISPLHFYAGIGIIFGAYVLLNLLGIFLELYVLRLGLIPLIGYLFVGGMVVKSIYEEPLPKLYQNYLVIIVGAIISYFIWLFFAYLFGLF